MILYIYIYIYTYNKHIHTHVYAHTHIYTHKHLNIHAVDTSAGTCANNKQLFCSAAIAKSIWGTVWELHQHVKLTIKHHNKIAVDVGHKNPTFGCRDGIIWTIIIAGDNAMYR